MRGLNKKQKDLKETLINNLEKTSSALRESINNFNLQLENLCSPIEELTDRYNELVNEANEFIENIHEDQETYSDERSDGWRDGDSGQAYADWAYEWSVTLDEIGIEIPDEIEEPNLVAVEMLKDLPDQP